MKFRNKYKVTTNSDHKQLVFDNVLDRHFEVTQPNQAYVGDITDLWTQEGWLYLAVVVDPVFQEGRWLEWSLKQERVQWRHYQTRYEARQDVLNYITMFYNRHRLHSYLGYKSPNQYEAERVTLKKVA